MDYNVLIVEVLLGLIILSAGFLAFRFFSRPEDEESALNLKGFEESIRKLIEAQSRTSSSTELSSFAGGTPEPSSDLMEEMTTQIDRLKIQLLQRTEEVEQLRSQLEAVGGSDSVNRVAPDTEAKEAGKAPSVTSGGATGNSEGQKALEEKIRDLEARLNEYSIIEDDIADLSFYKEETVRLQAEVDALKAKLAQYESGEGDLEGKQSDSSDEASQAPVRDLGEDLSSSPTGSTSPQELNQGDEGVQADAPPATAQEALTSTEGAPEAIASVDDDLMAEFERAVAEQKSVSQQQKEAARVVERAQESLALPTAEVASTETATEERVGTEMTPPASDSAESPAESPSEGSPPEELLKGSINMDKMLTEMDELPEEVAEDAVNVLDQQLDTDKLLQEATGMDQQVDTEAFSEFDSFLKKEGA